MKKLILISASVLIMALIIAATQIPAEPVTADATVSEDADFQLNGTTLVTYTGTAQTVSVPASVTAIGEEAFAGNTSMETLLFQGDDTETIAYRAFAGCTGLEEVVLPDSVRELGNGAFDGCTSLEKVSFGENVNKLGIGTFAGCTALEEIAVDEDNAAFTVEDGCLYNSDMTRLYLMLPAREGDTYSMPSTVTDIAEYAFWGCGNVENIILSSNLSAIPDYSFANCTSLERISIPYSVTSIGVQAFAGCNGLETVTIPATVEHIHDTAFDGCDRLQINASEGTYAYQYYQDWLERNPVESGDTAASDDAAGNSGTADTEDAEDRDAASGDASAEDADSAAGSTPGQSAAQDEDGNRDVLGSSYVVGNSAVVFIDNTQPVQGSGSEGNGADSAENGGTGAAGSTFEGEDIKKRTIWNGILADQAFYLSRTVREYQIPSGITEIGEFAFARSSLSVADIPDGVTTIGYGAFYHCDSLRDVEIPRSVTYIAPKAFAESLWLKNWLAGSGGDEYLVVGDGILLAYRGSGGNLVLPDTVKRIAPEAFMNHTDIVSVSLPDSLVEIGEDAFSGCRNLSTVTGGSNVEAIRDRAFSGCALQTAHVWRNVKYLGLNCFDFTTTPLSASGRIVVFDSQTSLPAASHEETAERLSNEQARGMVLGDTVIAVVDRSLQAEDLAGTVLAPDGNGFKGVVACISSREQKIVTCLASTYTEEELSAAYIPEYVTIDGESYQVTGADEITVFGEDRTYTPGSIRIQNESTALAAADCSAELTDNGGSYCLRMEDSGEAYTALNRGFQSVYQEALPQGAVCVDISLIDETTGVPVNRTGSRALFISLTLPGASAGNLRIYTVDRNGQLESLAYTCAGDTVTFETHYLSAFAFCEAGGAEE